MNRESDIDAIASWERAEQSPYPGRSNGHPSKFACLGCNWRGKGSIARAQHWHATKHCIVYSDDPRVARRVDPWLANREGR